MGNHDERMAAYIDGARAFNNGQPLADNPHGVESGMADAWEAGFTTRRGQVRATRAGKAIAGE